MVDSFSADGSQATASFQIERETGVQPLSRENVMAMAIETGADAVVVTRMLDYSAEHGKSKAEAHVKVGRQVFYRLQVQDRRQHLYGERHPRRCQRNR